MSLIGTHFLINLFCKILEMCIKCINEKQFHVNTVTVLKVGIFLLPIHNEVPDATGILSATPSFLRLLVASATRAGYTHTAAVVILSSFPSNPRATKRSDDNGCAACRENLQLHFSAIIIFLSLTTKTI